MLNNTFNEKITNHNKNEDFYPFKYEHNLSFDGEFHSHTKSKLQNNATIVQLKKFLIHWIDFFTEARHEYSQIYEMNITTVSNKRYMTYEYSIEQPMQLVELNLNMIKY